MLPWILKHFYKGYNSKTMVMSVLGSPESPVRKVYNIWLVWLGVFLLGASFLFYKDVKNHKKHPVSRQISMMRRRVSDAHEQ